MTENHAMKKRHVYTVTVVGLLAAAPVLGQRELSTVQIKTTHVAGSVHMLEGSGGNIGISAGDDGVLMIDDQFKELSEKLLAAIRKLGKGEPELIINTHWHPDHIGGNVIFGRKGHILAHTNVRLRLSTTQTLFDRAVEEDSDPKDRGDYLVEYLDRLRGRSSGSCDPIRQDIAQSYLPQRFN